MTFLMHPSSAFSTALERRKFWKGPIGERIGLFNVPEYQIRGKLICEDRSVGIVYESFSKMKKNALVPIIAAEINQSLNDIAVSFEAVSEVLYSEAVTELDALATALAQEELPSEMMEPDSTLPSVGVIDATRPQCAQQLLLTTTTTTQTKQFTQAVQMHCVIMKKTEVNKCKTSMLHSVKALSAFQTPHQ